MFGLSTSSFNKQESKETIQEPEDDQQAFADYQRDAERGSAAAKLKLGKMYEEGRGVAADQTKAIELYHSAAADLDDAKIALIELYTKNHTLDSTYQQRAHLTQQLLQSKHPKGYYYSGIMDYYGQGTVVNKIKGLTSLRVAAVSDRESQYMLYRILTSEEGMFRNVIDGIKYLYKAAENYAPAQVHLGLLYLNLITLRGKSIPQDDKKALEYFTLAVNNGDAEGAFQLAKLYHKGRQTVKPNQVEAFKLYRQAATKNHPGAIRVLSQFCQEKGSSYRKFLSLLFFSKRTSPSSPVSSSKTEMNNMFNEIVKSNEKSFDIRDFLSESWQDIQPILKAENMDVIAKKLMFILKHSLSFVPELNGVIFSYTVEIHGSWQPLIMLTTHEFEYNFDRALSFLKNKQYVSAQFCFSIMKNCDYKSKITIEQRMQLRKTLLESSSKETMPLLKDALNSRTALYCLLHKEGHGKTWDEIDSEIKKELVNVQESLSLRR